MKYIAMRFTVVVLLLCLLCNVSGCTTGSSQADYHVKAVTLNEEQQRLADGIWEAKNIWKGCSELALYQYEGEYYLAANYLVKEAKVNMEDLFGPEDGMVSVGTYKRYAYRIVDGKIVDDLNLGEEAGVLAVGNKVKTVFFFDSDTDTDKQARISQLAAYYY